MPDKQANELLEAALAYARLGFPVVPNHTALGGRCSCSEGHRCASPGKHPRTKNGVYDASTDGIQIRRWWQRWPDANIGIATGQIVLAADADRHDIDGVANWVNLCSSHGFNPAECPTVATGGDGLHCYFKPNGTVPPTRQLAPGVELCSTGKQVIAPPSMHASGKRYEWLRLPGAEMPTLPDFLLPPATTAPELSGQNIERIRAITDDRLLGIIRRSKQGPKFEKLWSGDNGEYPSGSEADFALCSMLAWWTGRDEGRVLRLFLLSALGQLPRLKRGEAKRTAQQACRASADVWAPEEDDEREINSLIAAQFSTAGGAPNSEAVVEREIELVTASTIEPEPIRWLWPNRIPLGKLTVFVGVPDMGKSAVSIDVVARGTRGGAWPDCENANKAFHVLMLVAEDDLADTVVPRLMAAKAELSRVHFARRTILRDKARRAERQIALDTDLAAVEQVLGQNKNVKLIVIDPLGSYLGRMKKNNEEEIRSLLTALKETAERCKVAVLSIDHFNKNIQQAAIHRLSGASALAAVPRAVWAFVRDDKDETRKTRLMLNAKLNVVEEAKKSGLKFKFCGSNVTIKDEPSNQPTIEWGGQSESNLEEVMQAQSDPSARREAKARAFLTAYLANGRRMATDIEEEAGKVGISRSALWEAKKTLKIVSDKVGVAGPWYWGLPAPAKHSKDAAA